MTQPPRSSRLARVRAALRLAGADALVVTHLPNVRYLSGFSGTAGALVVSETECRLLVDFRYGAAARAMGGGRDGGDFTVEVIEGSYDGAIAAALRAMDVRRIAVEGAWMPVSRFTRLSAALAGTGPPPLEGSGRCPSLLPMERLVEHVRAVKDDGEVATIREAARRLSAVAETMLPRIVAGRREAEIAADVDHAMRLAGFERPAFETIVASGPNSALPHARPTGRALADGEAVVLDFGGVYDGYCVDLTRTVLLGRASADLRRLFAAVREAQEAALAAVRPGATGSEIDRAARDVLDGHGLAGAFGHGTGHGLGLEVHEEPRIARKAEGVDDPLLEPGMVFTVEPGAYVPGLGGVRIEDDVLVTATGCEMLTAVGWKGQQAGD